MDRQRIYTSRIIKASALIPDTKTLLAAWDRAEPVAENLSRARRDNIFGKASRSRAQDILKIFRQRYFRDPQVGAALVTLAQSTAPDRWLVPLFYFFSAQNDRTLRDIALEVIYPLRLAGYSEIRVEQVAQAIRAWSAQGKTSTVWGEKTILRVAQNSLAALRDFGALQGAANKQIAPAYLPVEAFAFIAHWLMRRERSGNRVLESDEWRLFFLTVDGVERFFIEAHQEHLLSYQAAGSIVRLSFPAPSLEEYARVLTERAH